MTVQKLSISEYASNIQKYTENVSEEVVKGIVKHLGIALTNRDASLVSCSDKTELDRVREKFLKKKLQLTASDADLDRAINEVCTTMKDTRNKSRVTFYYLLAEKFDKLSLFK
ncbi:DUF2853 family protein [Pleurocapsa sp. PCC 7319]|uniref:DUF2853 family protein n=1 Tax=Pleurocapsa sp. PCC 7319 TaxID=118161 RepID=UPI00034D7653|nr:DUF2853 family protein [Pleurocapsa sp. PCC 7319]